MGSLFKPSQQKQTSTSTPWGPQGDQLKNVFGDAQGIYDSQKGTPYYSGELYAGMNPLTDQGINASAGYATGAGADAASNVPQLGTGAPRRGTARPQCAYDNSLMGAATTTRRKATSPRRAPTRTTLISTAKLTRRAATLRATSMRTKSQV
jgi:hypothetical protein